MEHERGSGTLAEGTRPPVGTPTRVAVGSGKRPWRNVAGLAITGAAMITILVGTGPRAGATDTPVEWTTTRVPHSAITIRVPKGWVEQPASAAPLTPPESHFELLLMDPRNGDNVLVLSYRGTGAVREEWFPTLAAYEANARRANQKIPGKEMVSSAATEVDGMPVYRSVDHWRLGGASYAVGDLQIRSSRNRVVQIESTTDLDGQPVIEAIFDSVARA